MSRNSQNVRILILLFELAKHRRLGLTIKQLQEHLKIKRRTLYRDLEALRAAGVEFYSFRIDGELRFRVTKVPGFYEEN
jgi:predicted DNA-binding transcriptional regulator YafY